MNSVLSFDIEKQSCVLVTSCCVPLHVFVIPLSSFNSLINWEVLLLSVKGFEIHI